MTESKPAAGGPPGRPFLGIMMKCCRTYVRAYLSASGDQYSGRCPRCGAFVRVPVVNEGGSSNRFFEAS
jgi:hypothetical protein